MKVEITQAASDNDTFLAPYVGYEAELKGNTLLLDGQEMDVSGSFTASNGWQYTIKDITKAITDENRRCKILRQDQS